MNDGHFCDYPPECATQSRHLITAASCFYKAERKKKSGTSSFEFHLFYYLISDLRGTSFEHDTFYLLFKWKKTYNFYFYFFFEWKNYSTFYFPDRRKVSLFYFSTIFHCRIENFNFGYIIPVLFPCIRRNTAEYFLFPSVAHLNTFTAIVDLIRSNFSIARAPLFQLKSAM